MLQQDAQGYRLPYRVRYPVELHLPPGFKGEEPATWPRVEGRLEYVGGRLLYMPPCGDRQQDVAMDIAYFLKGWSQRHPAMLVGGNEAGMVLGGVTRAADLAIWRRADAGPHTGGFRRVAPVLAVEIAGQDEGEAELRAKAAWYLAQGVAIVWLALPETREVVLLTGTVDERYAMGQRLPEQQALPGLSPEVAAFFTQLE